MSYFLQNFKLLPYKNLAPFILSIFFIVSCGDGNDENIAPIEVIMSASSEEVEYEEEYTISWESNASQCFATSQTGDWNGEKPTSGSETFLAKRRGVHNFGLDCRTSINFAQGSVNVSVNKTFEEYFDFVGSEIYELGEVAVESLDSFLIHDVSLGDFNQDLALDLLILGEDFKTEALGDSSFMFILYEGINFYSPSDDETPSISLVDSNTCSADNLARIDINADGNLDIISFSSNANESLNKRGLCIFLSTEEGLILQENSYLVNTTSLDLSNIAIASHELLDINVDSNGDVLFLGKGGTTDLPFYILASDSNPEIKLASSFQNLNPYSRAEGCSSGLSYLCDWINEDYDIKNSVYISADGDALFDIMLSVKKTTGHSYIAYTTRLEEDIDFDWSAPVHDVIQSSISSDDAYALKMMGFDANLDGLNDLLVLEGGTTSEGNLFKFSFHEQLSTDDFIGLNPENNGELADEFLFSSPLRFSNEFLRIDPNLDSYLDIFAPLTELPFDLNVANDPRHFIVIKKTVTFDEENNATQSWEVKDFSDTINLDANSIHNVWVDFDIDQDFDALLIKPGTDLNNPSFSFSIHLNDSR